MIRTEMSIALQPWPQQFSRSPVDAVRQARSLQRISLALPPNDRFSSYISLHARRCLYTPRKQLHGTYWECVRPHRNGAQRIAVNVLCRAAGS